MYAQLNDNKSSNSTLSDKISSKVSSPSSSSGVIGITRGKKTMNEELETSLIGDNLQNGSITNCTNDHSSVDDPFYVFKEDLEMKLELVDDGLNRFERIVQMTDTAVNTNEVKETKKQLKRHIKNAESTLKDLQTTVSLVEKNREKFNHISNYELDHRKSFIQSSYTRIKTVKQSINSENIKSKLLSDERAKSKRRLGLLGAKSDDFNDGDEEMQFIANNYASTQLLMQQQDETLDELDDAVVRVGHMAENIHEELGQQNKMLSELEEDLTNAEEQLGVVMGRLAKMLKTKSKWQLGVIMILTVIVIVLFFLVLE